MKVFCVSLLTFIAVACCNQQTENQSNAVSSSPQKNEVVENILNRRSIRSYKSEQVAQAQLDTIINCAINAPSAVNRQPWEVRVVQHADLLKKINDRVKTKSNNTKEDYSVFYNAPTLIIVARDKQNNYSASDCGMLAQNILLSAESLGLGTCVIGSLAGVFNDSDSGDLLKAIKLPDTHEVIYGIALGYKNETPDAKPREKAKVQFIR
ncbi:MAG: nitroreductase [Bacteroidales bacterium]|nr:nitroreductase [Bacteroidales bacterium]